MEVPLGHGQVMMAPKIEGRLLQALAIEPTDRVLEVGTGSGYLTACLARLAGHVTSVEYYADFVEAARNKLARFSIDADVQTADAMTLTCSRSEEHTSELQPRENLVCRLLLEKTDHS